jgi:phosphoheptose isomerase
VKYTSANQYNLIEYISSTHNKDVNMIAFSGTAFENNLDEITADFNTAEHQKEQEKKHESVIKKP